jgi:hypothetical protein
LVLDIFAVAALCIIGSLEKDSGTGATITLAIFLIVYFCLAGHAFKDTLLWVRYNPLITIAGLVGYVFAGVIWSFAKWYFYLLKKKRSGNLDKYVSVDGNKGRLIAWATYWPFSLFWAILNQPARYIFNEMYYRVSGIYENILKNVREDETPENS